MKDYSIKFIVKNNIMLTAIKSNGFKSAAHLSRHTGIPSSSIGLYLNLKKIPYRDNGEFRTDILVLAKALRTLPEDLFPVQHLHKKMDRNTAMVEMSR